MYVASSASTVETLMCRLKRSFPSETRTTSNSNSPDTKPLIRPIAFLHVNSAAAPGKCRLLSRAAVTEIPESCSERCLERYQPTISASVIGCFVILIRLLLALIPSLVKHWQVGPNPFSESGIWHGQAPVSHSGQTVYRDLALDCCSGWADAKAAHM
jgi:hypothetical protein